MFSYKVKTSRCVSDGPVAAVESKRLTLMRVGLVLLGMTDRSCATPQERTTCEVVFLYSGEEMVGDELSPALVKESDEGAAHFRRGS